MNTLPSSYTSKSYMTFKFNVGGVRCLNPNLDTNVEKTHVRPHALMSLR